MKVFTSPLPTPDRTSGSRTVNTFTTLVRRPSGRVTTASTSRSTAPSSATRTFRSGSDPGSFSSTRHSKDKEKGAVMNTQTLMLEVCHSRLARIAVTIVCAAGVMSGSASAQTYTVTDLGTLGGSESYPVAINAAGQVVGTSWVANLHDLHGFLFSGGAMTDVGTLGGSRSYGNAINAAGHVTGTASTADDYWEHAYVFANNAMTDLGTLGGSWSIGYAINASGHVAGISTIPGDIVVHAFLYRDGFMTDIGTLGGTNAYAYAINDAGQATGESWTTTNGSNAFLYSNGVMTDLGNLGGGASRGLAINAA